MEIIKDEDMAQIIKQISDNLAVHIYEDGIPLEMDGKLHNALLDKHIFKGEGFITNNVVHNFKQLAKTDKFISFCNLNKGNGINMLLIHISYELSDAQREILYKFYSYLKQKNIDMSFIFAAVYKKNGLHDVISKEFMFDELFEYLNNSKKEKVKI